MVYIVVLHIQGIFFNDANDNQFEMLVSLAVHFLAEGLSHRRLEDTNMLMTKSGHSLAQIACCVAKQLSKKLYSVTCTATCRNSTEKNTQV